MPFRKSQVVYNQLSILLPSGHGEIPILKCKISSNYGCIEAILISDSDLILSQIAGSCITSVIHPAMELIMETNFALCGISSSAGLTRLLYIHSPSE